MNAVEQKTAMVKYAAFFNGKEKALAEVIPPTSRLTPARIIKLALAAATRMPELLECSIKSVYAAVHQAAQVGLEPGGVLGGAYIVPFRNKAGGKDAQLIIGYRGMIDLARRSGQIQSIEAHVVHENDEFDASYGTNGGLRHKRDWRKPAGKVVAVYAFARLVGGGEQYDVLSVPEVEAVRARGRGSDRGPWATDWNEMAKKTAIRRLWKLLPMSIEMERAVEAEETPEETPEDTYEGGPTVPTTATEDFDGPEPEPHTPEVVREPTRTEPAARTVEPPKAPEAAPAAAPPPVTPDAVKPESKPAAPDAPQPGPKPKGKAPVSDDELAF